MSDRSSLGFQLLQNAIGFRPRSRYADYSFVAILALAQRLNIDFLPFTWQPALGSLGEGGQAVINQALVKLQTSLAFKSYRETSDHRNSRNPLQEIVSEIIVFSYSSICEHPNILRLEGICWDISQEDQVSPVLVFETSSLGDLYHFKKSQGGQILSMEDRLKLCMDVGIALRDMHANRRYFCAEMMSRG